MIAFIFALLYSAMSLLSPSVLPEAILQLHVADILGVLTIVSVVIYLGQAKLGSMTETYLALGILVSAALSVLATGWMGGVAQFIIGFLPIILNFFFIVLACRSLFRLRVFTFVLLLTALFILCHGALALYSGDYTNVYLEQEGTGDLAIYRLRGLGVLNDPNDLAQFFVMLLPLLWLRWGKRLTANIILTVVPACLLLYGIFLTHSRGGMIAVIAVLLFGFRHKLGLIGSAILTAAALAGMIVLNVAGNRGITEDDGGRVAAWATGLEVFKTHPLVGVGIGNFGDYNSTGMTAHNSFVLGLAESGILGYFCWIGMIVCVWVGLEQIVSRGRQPAIRAESETLVHPAALEPLTAAQAGVQKVSTHELVLPDLTYSNSLASVTTPWQPLETSDPDGQNTASLQHEIMFSARAFQISLVGLLTASFFLSRTYSMPLYIVLGMAVALKSLSEPPVQVARGLLFKRIGMVVLASILFLYIFVRVRGGK